MKNKCTKITLLLAVFTLFIGSLNGQKPVDHWETVVFAGDEWRYRPGNTEPPVSWMNPDFDDSFWALGPGGFGYGDDDDATTISITNSIYLRKEFELIDTSVISSYLLHADYDDAFIIYINGVELARANIGQPGDIEAYDAPVDIDHEAQIYQGGLPEAFTLDYSLLSGIIHNGMNTIAIQVQNKSVFSSDLSSIFYLSLGINDTSEDYFPVHEYFISFLESSNLPILNIYTDNNVPVMNNVKVNGDLGIIDNGPNVRNYLTDPYNDYDGRIGVEIRGSSSSGFPKKNYTIETRDSVGDNNNVKLLGMPKENDWVLHGPYADKSLLRNALSYHIGQMIGQYTPRYRFCELMVNDTYQGVYILTEKIKRDKNRVDIAKVTEEDIEGDELSGGYLLKIDRDNLFEDDGWYSEYKTNVFYSWVDPEYHELLPVQKQYITDYISGFEDAVKQDGAEEVYDDYLDMPAFIDYWIATEIFKHIDGWKLSFYMFKKKDSNGGKLHLGPLWDLNLGYGNYDFGFDPGPEGWSYDWANTTTNRPFWVPEISDVPVVSDAIRCRWNELRNGPLHSDSLFLFLDDKYDFLQESQERNFERWNILGKYVWPNAFVGNTYEEEFDFLVDWLDHRLAWMDQNMLGACIVDNENNIISSMDVSVYPNPVLDGTLRLNINNSREKNLSLEIYNVSGIKVFSNSTILKRDYSVDVSSFLQGIYYYRYLNQGQIIGRGKFIILND